MAKIEKTFERGITGAPPVEAKTTCVHVSIDDVARVAVERKSRNGTHNVLPRGLAGSVNQACHHVDALHRLHRIPACIGEIQAAVNSARRLLVHVAGIKLRERVGIVHFRDSSIGIAEAYGNTGNRIDRVHQRESRKVSVGRGWCPRQHVQVGLRPSQPKNAPQDANQPVLNVGQLRTGGGADSVDHHDRVCDVPGRGEVVGPAIDGVGEAIGQASSALTKQRISDGSVIIVNNSNRSGGGCRCDVCGSGNLGRHLKCWSRG